MPRESRDYKIRVAVDSEKAYKDLRRLARDVGVSQRQVNASIDTEVRRAVGIEGQRARAVVSASREVLRQRREESTAAQSLLRTQAFASQIAIRQAIELQRLEGARARTSLASTKERILLRQGETRAMEAQSRAELNAARTSLTAAKVQTEALRQRGALPGRSSAGQGSFSARFLRGAAATRYQLPGPLAGASPIVGSSVREGLPGFLGGAAVGVGMAAQAGIAIALGEAAQAAVGFDAAMRNVNSISQLSEARLRSLQGQVVQLAQDPAIRVGPQDLAKGLYDVVSSGFEGDKALQVLRAGAIAASAGLTDTGTATHALVSVLNSGITGFQGAQQASDLLFQTVNLGVLTFPELAASIGQVLTTAAKAGISLQEVGAAIALMTRSGSSASEATNDLLNLIAKLTNPSKEAEAEFRRLGISYGFSGLQAKGLAGVLAEINAKTGGQGDLVKDLLSDMQAQRGALGLLQSGGVAYNDMLRQMNQGLQGQGATARANAEQQKSLAAEWQNVKKELEIIAIEFGPAILGFLREAIEAGRPLLEVVKGLADSFAALSDEQQSAFLIDAAAVAGAVTAIGIVAKSVWGLVTAWKMAAAAQAMAGVAQGGAAAEGAALGAAGATAAGGRLAMLGRLGAVGLGAAAVGAGGVYLGKRFMAARDAEMADMGASTEARIRQIDAQIRTAQQRGHPADQPGMPGSPQVQRLLKERQALEGVLRAQKGAAGRRFYSSLNPLAGGGGVLSTYSGPEEGAGGGPVMPGLSFRDREKLGRQQARERAAEAAARRRREEAKRRAQAAAADAQRHWQQAAAIDQDMKARQASASFDSRLKTLGESGVPTALEDLSMDLSMDAGRARDLRRQAALSAYEKASTFGPGLTGQQKAARTAEARAQRRRAEQEAEEQYQSDLRKIQEARKRAEETMQRADEEAARRKLEQQRRETELASVYLDGQAQRAAAVKESAQTEGEMAEDAQALRAAAARLRGAYTDEAGIERQRAQLERDQQMREALSQASEERRRRLEEAKTPEERAQIDSEFYARYSAETRTLQGRYENRLGEIDTRLQDNLLRPGELDTAARVAELAPWPEDETARAAGQGAQVLGESLAEGLVSAFQGRLMASEIPRQLMDTIRSSAARGIQDALQKRLTQEFDTLWANLRGVNVGLGKNVQGLLGAGAALYGALSLFGAFGKKKQGGSLLGGALGLALGSVLPGVSLAQGFLGGAALGGLIPRAAGGPITRGRAYLVGERGPELLVPGRDGTVLPIPGRSVHVSVQIDRIDSARQAEYFGRVLADQIDDRLG